MRKNKIMKTLETNIPFTPNYEKIKEHINVLQYVKEKEKRKDISCTLSIISILFPLIILSTIILSSYKLNKPKFVDGKIEQYESVSEFVDQYEYIFIAKITKKVKTVPYDGTGTKVAYSFYEMELDNVIKGNDITQDSLICFYGGRSFFEYNEIYVPNSELLEIGSYYLIFTNKEQSLSNNLRIGENDLILSQNIQKIKLFNYSNNKPIIEQTPEIKELVNEYQNVVENNFKLELYEQKLFGSKEEMIKLSDYAMIIRVSELKPTITNSENANMLKKYYITIINCFKGNIEEQMKLQCKYTSFWGTFDDYENILKPGEYYLLFTNKITNNNQEIKIQIGDYGVVSSQQLVRIEDYDENIVWDEQKPEIVSFIKEYIDLIQK